MQNRIARLAVLFVMAVVALLGMAALSNGTASAETNDVGCLCPRGYYEYEGEWDYNDSMIGPPYYTGVFSPFGSGGCYGSYQYPYSYFDEWELEICNSMVPDSDLMVEVYGPNMTYPYPWLTVYWNNGMADPFVYYDSYQETCTNAICNQNQYQTSVCSIPAVTGVGLYGYVDVVVADYFGYSYGPGGAYDLTLESTMCPKPKVDGVGIEALNLEEACTGSPVQVAFTLTNSGDLDQADNSAGLALGGHEFRATILGNWQIVGAAPDAGTCSFSGSVVNCDFAIAAGETRTVHVLMDPYGGLGTTDRFGAIMQVELDEDQDGANEALYTYETEDPFEIECPYIIDPNKQLGMQVHLPILSFMGMDTCETWIEVQNVGCLPVKAVLVTWGEAGFCPPQAAGPLKVECTGLLKPGTTWNLIGDQIPDGSKSGMLFRFNSKQLSDYGLDATFGFDDILADLMCETLFFGVVGDADDFRRFKKAYNEGGDFGGIPQDIASGADNPGILAVDVLRTCDADITAGAKVTSKYNGIAGSHLGQYDPVYGGYSYYVPLIYAKRTTGTGAEYNTWVYIQNGGLECSSVEIWMKKQDDCLRAQICELSTLAPGETYQFDPSTCVGAGWLGSLWIRTSQPMGIAVDIWGNDILMTYIGEPAELNYTFDPGQAEASPGNQVAFGPLIYSEYQGWDSGIQVQNLSPVLNAKVKVYFLDRSGDVITTLVDWICPRGSQTFFLPIVAALPGDWVGSVRVESQEWLTPGGPRVFPPNIVAVATLIKYADAQRAATREAIAYNLLPEHKIFDWQIGLGAGGLKSGIGLIAIPSLLADLDGTGVTSELAIANVVPKPGFTDFVIYIYDQNGLLDYVCQKLNEKQVEYIDLNSWGFINNGFKGSAIISAFFWEHDVFSGDGRFLRNLVGLGAVAIERSHAALGDDVPGDEAAGARGIPFMQSDVEDAEFEFCFLGDYPACPGLPDRRPKPGECTPTADGDFQHIYAAGGANPNGGQLQYIGIAGTNSVPNGGVCAPLSAAYTHNWNATEFEICQTGGDLVVTCNAWSLTPYTGGSCGWSTHLQGLLYSVPIADIDLADGCANLVQDVAEDFYGAGYFASGTVKTFTSECWVHGIGTYTFASMPGCDAAGPGLVTGSGDFTLDFP